MPKSDDSNRESRSRTAAKLAVLGQVVALLLVATVLDYVTGPTVTAAAFYVFPVVLAGWRSDWEGGVATAVAAMAINVPMERIWDIHPLSPEALAATEAVRFVVLLLAAAIGTVFKRQNEAVMAQRDELARLNRHMENEMRAARAIQKVLTSERPAHPAVEIAELVRPARILCGDTIHLSIGPDDVLAFAVADVSGKGTPAALAGAVVIGLLEDAPPRYTSPGETLRYLNRRTFEVLPNEMFATVFYGLLHLRTGELTFACGGHELPFLMRAGGENTELPCGGSFPLGLFVDTQYPDMRLRMSPGDTLLVYSDGLTDHRRSSGERLGKEWLAETLLSVHGLSCEDMIHRLLDRAMDGQEASGDDITLLAVRYRGTPAP